jgi:hypothetical protein
MANEPMSTRDIAGGGAATTADVESADQRRFERDTTTGVEAADAENPTTAPTPADQDPTNAADGSSEGHLLSENDQAGMRTQWEEIQGRFVDDPRRAVEDADALVAQAMQQLADGFATERERLEGMWGRGEDVGTEDLRVTLQRYRAFFHRLLAV